MSKLQFDKDGERFYELGVSECVLFTKTGTQGAYATGVAWNGITAINESPSGGEANNIYADNIKYLVLRSTEEFNGSIEAYSYPDAFGVCDGSAALGVGLRIGQQKRSPFGLVYKTNVGNDLDGYDHAFKYHVVYGASVSPTEKGHSTINDNPDPETFSWDFETEAVKVSGYRPTAHFEIDTRYASESGLASFLDCVYGTDPDPDTPQSVGTDPTMPTVTQLMTWFPAPTTDDEDDET